MSTRNGDNTSLDNAEIVWDEDDPGGKTMRIRYPEPDYDQEAMAATKEKMDRLLYENYRQDAKGDATALAKPSELDAVTPHKVLTAGQKRELQAMKAASDLIDLVNKPMEWTLGKANDVTGGAVYGFLGNPYVMAVMNTLTPSKWIGAAQTGYMPWDKRNTGIQPGFEGVDLEELSGYDLSHIYNNLFDTGAEFIPVGGWVRGRVTRLGKAANKNKDAYAKRLTASGGTGVARSGSRTDLSPLGDSHMDRYKDGVQAGVYTGYRNVPVFVFDFTKNWSKYNKARADYHSFLASAKQKERNLYLNFLAGNIGTYEFTLGYNKLKTALDDKLDQLTDGVVDEMKRENPVVIFKGGRKGKYEFKKGQIDANGIDTGDYIDYFYDNLARNMIKKDGSLLNDGSFNGNVFNYGNNKSKRVIHIFGDPGDYDEGFVIGSLQGPDYKKAKDQFDNITLQHELDHYLQYIKDLDPSLLPDELKKDLIQFMKKGDHEDYFTKDAITGGEDFGEVSVRFSQLKDHLRKKYGEEVTREELLRAADDYVKATGMDNTMTPFVDWIKHLDDRQLDLLLHDYVNNPRAVLQWAGPFVGGGLGLWAGSRLFGSGSDEGDEGIEWE